MCGIIGGYSEIEKGVAVLAHRGPDAQAVRQFGAVQFGHTRLSILDPDPRSDQPFERGKLALVYNGELWNYRDLRTRLKKKGRRFTTTGDTEVIAAALLEWGMDAIPLFDGQFALAWTTDGETIGLARDRFGEIPLHYALTRPFLFASEAKALIAQGCPKRAIELFPPGHTAQVTPAGMALHEYYRAPCAPRAIDRQAAAGELFTLLDSGTRQREMSDVPICTLLSGGIDSSAVAYFLARDVPGLVAYTAVLDPKSADLKSARLVARALGIELREVPVTLPTPDDLADVIAAIEMDSKAQIEIGWACFALARQMRQDGFKVTFSGEGSDELWGSYGFAYHALKTQNWHAYRRGLFEQQHRKNFMRCNKIFMAHSVECRLPFLHVPLVEFALSLPRSAVEDGRRQKAVMRDAFTGVLPDPIVNRAKVAFQDGLGLKRRIETILPQAKRFYHAEYARRYA